MKSLFRMMQVNGVGCGENCACAKNFLDSLDNSQLALLSEMMHKGAQVRFEAFVGSGEAKDHTCL